MKKMNPIVKSVLVYLLVILLPAILGLIFSLIFSYFTLLEIFFAVFGIFELLLVTLRLRLRDKRNLKKTKSVYEDHYSKEYKEFRKEQWIIFALGLVHILASVITGIIIGL